MAWWRRTRSGGLDPVRVGAAVEAAERRTSAEIVVAIAPFFLGSVWRAARRAFGRLGIARTRRRNGVLIFIVPTRRQVVVLADDGVHARLDPAAWEPLAARIGAAFGRGEATSGLIDAVCNLGDLLADAFPHRADDVNELGDVVLVRTGDGHEPPNQETRR